MIRSFDINGKTYETYYDGSFKNFQARSVGDPGTPPSVAVMSRLFAANRYLDLVVDLDAQALVTPTQDLVLAAGALAASDYLVDMNFAVLEGIVGLVVSNEKNRLIRAPDVAELIPSSSVLSAAIGVGAEWSALSQEFGRSKALLAWLQQGLENAADLASDFTVARAVLAHQDDTDATISLDAILSAYSKVSLAYGTAKAVSDTLLFDLGYKDKINQTALGSFTKSFFDAVTGWVPRDKTDLVEGVIGGVTPFLSGASQRGIEAFENILTIYDAALRGNLANAEAEMAEALAAFYQPGLRELPLDIFAEKLVHAAPGGFTQAGFHRVTDLEGDSIDDAATAAFERQSDGTIVATIAGSLSPVDRTDMFALEVAEGTVLRYRYPGVTNALLTTDGTAVALTYSGGVGGSYTSAALAAGTYYLRLQDFSIAQKDYATTVEMVNSTLLEPDDRVNQATDFGTLAAGSHVRSDTLGGPMGLDLVDHYKFTLTAPSRVVLSAAAVGVGVGEVALRLGHSGLFTQYRDVDVVAEGLLDASGLIGTELSLGAGTYTVSIEGDGSTFGYDLSLAVTEGFGGLVDTVSGGSPGGFGAGDDVITQTNGFVQTEGGRDLIIYSGGGSLDAGDQNDRVELRGFASSSGTLDGGAGTDTLTFNGPRLRMEFVDDAGDAIGLGNTVADFLAAKDAAAGLRYNLWPGSGSYVVGQFQNFERYEALGSSAVDGVVIWAPGLSVYQPAGYSSFYADWRAFDGGISWTGKGLTGVDGLSISGTPRAVRVASGSGDDTFLFATGFGATNVHLDTGGGDDTVEAAGFIATGGGDDSFTGSGTIDLGDGDDTAFVTLSTAATTLDGGTGHDSVTLDLEGATGGFYFRSWLTYNYFDSADSTWKRLSGDWETQLDLIPTITDWRIEARASSYANSAFYVTLDNVEDLHLGGGHDGNTFVWAEGLASVNGYGSGNFLANWSDRTEAIVMTRAGKTDHFSTGVSVTDVQYSRIKTGSGDDVLDLVGSAFTGDGDDTVILRSTGLYGSGIADTGAGNDRVITLGSAIVSLGEGDDELATHHSYGGTFEGGAGSDVIDLGVKHWRWTDADGAEQLITDFAQFQAFMQHYASGGSVRAERGSGSSNVVSTLSGFETVHQTGADQSGYDWDAFVDFGNGTEIDGKGGSYDRLFADWSATTKDVVLDFTLGDIWQATPTGGRIRNVEDAVIRTGSGNDILRLNRGTFDIETGAGKDDVRMASGGFWDKRLDTGSGDDVVALNNSINAMAQVMLGAGKDIIALKNARADVDGGAGKDLAILGGQVSTTQVQEADGTWTAINFDNFARLQAAQGTDTAIRLTGNMEVSLKNVETVAMDLTGGGHIWDMADRSFIRGDSATDYIHLGSGRDMAQGQGGADNYYFHGRFGRDVIEDTTSGDHVHFVGARAAQLSFRIKGDDLIANHANGSQLTIRDYVAQSVNGRGWDFRADDGMIALDVATLRGAPTIPSNIIDPLTGLKVAPDPRLTPLNGTNGDDLLVGGMGSEIIKALDGDDIIEARAGDDRIFAGAGDDWIIAGPGAKTYDGGTGTDTLSFEGYRGAAVDLALGSLYGTAGVIAGVENVIGYVKAANYIYGDAADNRIVAFGFNDNLRGAGGNDQIVSGDGNDSVLGGAGHDLLRAGAGDDTVGGEGGNDWIFGDAGADILNGGAGNDVLSGGSGDDVISGGKGKDTALFDGSVGTTVRLNTTAAQATGHGDDRLIGIENVSTAGGNDRLTGNGKANVLISGAGNDRLDGGNGKDVLSGGAGNDVIKGGKGSDTAVFDGAVDTTVRLGTGAAQATGHGKDRLLGIENVTSAGGDDRLTGNGKANELNSGDGNDQLSGGRGDDTLKGGAGADVLSGDAGDDVLIGGSGSDAYIYRVDDGSDRIVGFEDNADEIRLDVDLWGGGQTRAQVVSTFGSVVSGNCILDFGSGQKIEIVGFTDLNSLADDLILI